jgi:hypothetical protein
MGQWVSSNHNNVDEYMGSSLPFTKGAITAATTGTKVKFPYVTRWIQIFNNHATRALRVGFTENGVTANPDANYFVIKAGESSARLEIKCMELWLAGDGGSGTASIIAGYTNIPEDRFLSLTGSEGFSGIG